MQLSIFFLLCYAFLLTATAAFFLRFFASLGTPVLFSRSFRPFLRFRLTSSISLWWAQMDSDHRPHAYQACALTS